MTSTNEVARLLADGLTDETVARRLGVSPRTVSRAVDRLKLEHGAASRFQLGFVLGRVAGVDR